MVKQEKREWEITKNDIKKILGEEELRWENMSEESEYEMKYDATRRGTTPQHTTPHLIIFVFEFISRVEENIVDGLIETYRVGFF